MQQAGERAVFRTPALAGVAMGIVALAGYFSGDFSLDILWCFPVAAAAIISSMLLFVKTCWVTIRVQAAAMLFAAAVATGLLVVFAKAALAGEWLMLENGNPDIFGAVYGEVFFAIAMVAGAILNILLLWRSCRLRESGATAQDSPTNSAPS